MPSINAINTKLKFKYNIAEYMFYLSANKKVKLKKTKNVIKTINTKNYGTNYWEFTKKKVIWSRKNGKIINEIDFDNKAIEKMKKSLNQNRENKDTLQKKYKVNMFDRLNKFKKYDSLEIKNNRRI